MNPEYVKTAERFAAETAKHEMTVLLDQGLYRHLRFMNPSNSAYWFELHTAPGSLTFQGDGDAFVFRRLQDMFAFFRRSGNRPDGSIWIQPDYWDEKLQAPRDSVKTYSMDKFEAEVAAALEEGEETHPGVTAAWRDAVDNEFNTEYEAEAHRALEDFEFGGGYQARCSCGANSEAHEYSSVAWQWKDAHAPGEPKSKHQVYVDSLAFQFDWHEWNLRDHDWWFLWACHAIVWGIAQYDALKAAEVQAVTAGSAS